MSEITMPAQQEIAAEMHALALRAQEEQRLDAAFEAGNQQSYDDWNSYLEARPFQDNKGNVHNPGNGQFIGTNGDYFDQKRGEHYEQILGDTKVDYEAMSMSELAKEAAHAEVGNDQTKFAELDGILSAKVEGFADGVKTSRNPNGLSDESREAMHVRIRKLVDKEKNKLTQDTPSDDTNNEPAQEEIRGHVLNNITVSQEVRKARQEGKNKPFDQDAGSQHQLGQAQFERAVNGQQELSQAVTQVIEAHKSGDQEALGRANAELDEAFNRVSQTENWDDKNRRARQEAVNNYIESETGKTEEAEDAETSKDKKAGFLRSRIRKIRENLGRRNTARKTGDVRGIVLGVKEQETERETRRGRLGLIIGAAALAGAGAYYLAKYGWDNPFDHKGTFSIFGDTDHGDKVCNIGKGSGNGLSGVLEQGETTPNLSEKGYRYVEWAHRMQQDNPDITQAQLDEMISRAAQAGQEIPHTL